MGITGAYILYKLAEYFDKTGYLYVMLHQDLSAKIIDIDYSVDVFEISELEASLIENVVDIGFEKLAGVIAGMAVTWGVGIFTFIINHALVALTGNIFDDVAPGEYACLLFI